MSNNNEQNYIQSLQQKTENDNVDAVRQVYDDWAGSYDSDLRDLGYVAPREATAVLTEILPNRNSLILDGGCGTGLVGYYLQQQGYTQLHGCDYSTEMLAGAEKTGYYDWLGVVDMTQPFPLENARYDAALCVGVLGPRLPAEPMVPELVRVVKPGGLVLLVIREEWYVDRLQTAIQQVMSDNLAMVEREKIRPYIVEGDVNGRYLTLRKH